MRVLLDTNIIIHREANRVIKPEIGTLFFWLDKLHMEKCIHPLTLDELKKHSDANIVRVMTIKAGNYIVLKTVAPLHDEVKKVSAAIDKTENDSGDTALLNEVYNHRVDMLISEDKKIHTKAKMLGVDDKVFYIEDFLEKVTSENPELVDYNVLSVRKVCFGSEIIDLNNSFFDSFREDYSEFNKWFNKKADEIAYVCFQNNALVAFLYIKVEAENENYSDINPILPRKRRLKIGTFKVISNGFKIGERFLKIIFDNALKQRVEEIYVTIFDKRHEQQRLINLLEEWGFVYHGNKATANGDEKVYVRDFNKKMPANISNPKLTYPFISKQSNVFIVPIEHQYHTELFPDSRLKTESPLNFVENEPHRNSITKSYISYSHERNLVAGDLIVFYRKGETSPKLYSSVVSTIGIVERVHNNIPDFEHLKEICKRRTVLKEEELKAYWNKYKYSRPFVVDFLYAHSFPIRPNLKSLLELGVIKSINDVPRGFEKLTREQFQTLVNFIYKK